MTRKRYPDHHWPPVTPPAPRQAVTDAMITDIIVNMLAERLGEPPQDLIARIRAQIECQIAAIDAHHPTDPKAPPAPR